MYSAGDGTVISLKEYLDLKFQNSQTSGPARRELLEAAMQSYRSSLLGTGSSGYQACPTFGANLQQSLTDWREDYRVT